MKKKSVGSVLFDSGNALFLTLLAIATVVPFIYVVSASFATQKELLEKGFILFPTQFSLDGYRYIFSSDVIFKSLMVTVFITVAGTLLNLMLTVTMAYPLARRNLDGRRILMALIVFTILFNGGMIPTYMVVKWTGLLDSYWSVIVPTAISAFNLIILKNFFQHLPEALEESAQIDGCSDIGILFKIALPLSMPAIATFTLFYAVGHWNNYFTAILYINDAVKWPIQVWLRQIVILSEGGIGNQMELDSNFVMPPGQTIKMAVIVISTLPILALYPFLQKHFAKGVLLGSVKG